jgi:pimeloyl-ACP methyl ester carboxylesterase
MAALRDSTISMPDGRRLAYTEWGVADGTPVVYCVGRPGSRLGCPDERATAAAGVRLIVPDRPGTGGSDPLPGRTLADWPADVAALADALGIGSFAVVGVSGGGPYALACAALIPGRLTAVAEVNSGLAAQFDRAGRPGIEERWPPRMRARFELARTDPAGAARKAAEDWIAILEPAWRPEEIRREIEEAEGDRWFYADAERVAAFDASCLAWSRQGAAAVGWDLNDLLVPWGFRLTDITMPVAVFHGAQDSTVDATDIDHTIRALRRSTLVVWPDSGHMGCFKHWDEVLAAVT